MIESKFFTVRLLKKQIIAQNIWELQFEKPAGFLFKAGQFVQFKIPSSEGVVLRSYSISSAPTANYLEFCIKYLPDGKASQFFDALGVGDAVTFSGSKGLFILPKELSVKKYFIATGTGFAPIMSILEDEMMGESNLLFGVRTEEDLFWLERLNKLKEKKVDFNYRLTLSRPSESWTGLKGRVSDHLEFDSDAHYYICGNVEMVKDVRGWLIGKGLNTKSIHFEIF